MIGNLLLAGALLVSPIHFAENLEDETEIVVGNEEEPEEVELGEKEIEISAIVDYIADNLDWVKNFLSAVGIGVGSLSLSTVVSLIVVAFRAVSNSLKLKKSNSETLADVKGAVLSEMKKELQGEFDYSLKPTLEEINKKFIKDDKLRVALTKIVALSQSNDVSSRLAILDCIAELGVIDEKQLEEQKEEIIEVERHEVQKVENAKSELDELIAETENINESLSL